MVGKHTASKDGAGSFLRHSSQERDVRGRQGHLSNDVTSKNYLCVCACMCVMFPYGHTFHGTHVESALSFYFYMTSKNETQVTKLEQQAEPSSLVPDLTSATFPLHAAMKNATTPSENHRLRTKPFTNINLQETVV